MKRTGKSKEVLMIRNQANRAAVPPRAHTAAPAQDAPEQTPPALLRIAMADHYQSLRQAESPHALEAPSPYPTYIGSEALRSLGDTIRAFDT
jgi:hypothetical protein